MVSLFSVRFPMEGHKWENVWRIDTMALKGKELKT